MKLEKLSNFLLLIVARTKTMRKTNTRLLIGLNKELQLISSSIKFINILEVWRTYTQAAYMCTEQDAFVLDEEPSL